MNMKPQFRTIIISDLHLGTEGSKSREVSSFLKTYSCERLILNGDIVDGGEWKKYGLWKRKHTAFVKAVLKMIDRWDTKVIYIRGNHDDFLDHIMPFRMGKNFEIRRDYVLKSGDKSYFVVHGDVFDTVNNYFNWLAYLGDFGYSFLLWVNKKYNYYRIKTGLPYYSLSRRIKKNEKMAVSYISHYEQKLTDFAKSKDCDGVICGHIHHPAIKNINGVNYMNSGDWVESMSALVEDHDGNWSLMYYNHPNHYSKQETTDNILFGFGKQSKLTAFSGIQSLVNHSIRP